MKHQTMSARITLWANRVILCIVSALIFLLPRLLDWYASIRLLNPGQEKAITVAFYCCAIVILYALWTMELLLRNILRLSVFIPQNVSLIRKLCICCGLVGAICLPAGFYYPPLIFLTIIMGFLCLSVNVVCQVFHAAVALQEENDLTI